MSQIIVLNDKINNERDYYFYCLDSHGEFTFILESKGNLIYAEIFDVMTTTYNPRNHKDQKIINMVKAFIEESRYE